MSDYSALVQEIFEKLENKGWMLATAESCTGGLIGAAITEVSGSSAYYDRGFITYSNEAKMEMLGVSRETLGEHGAVSPQIAKKMAIGALKNSNARISISVTGIAGPDGGSQEKPVGLVYIGIAMENGAIAFKNNFEGNRLNVRQQTVEKALNLLLEALW